MIAFKCWPKFRLRYKDSFGFVCTFDSHSLWLSGSEIVFGYLHGCVKLFALAFFRYFYDRALFWFIVTHKNIGIAFSASIVAFHVNNKRNQSRSHTMGPVAKYSANICVCIETEYVWSQEWQSNKNVYCAILPELSEMASTNTHVWNIQHFNRINVAVA